MKKIKLPLISYCGINFGNNRWSGHKERCDVCKKEHEKIKNEAHASWSVFCKCGCGKKTNYGDEYIHGHWLKTSWDEEKKEKQSKKWKEKNPLFKLKNKKFGNDNPSKRDDVRRKISENNSMKSDVYRKKAHDNWMKTDGIEKLRYNATHNNPSKNKEILEKRINTYTKNLSEGKYTIKNNWKTGFFYKKDGTKEWFDSSYEEKRMIYYEKQNIIWTKKHGIRIPYINDNGLNTFYVPDFLIIIDNKKIIEEIKGWIKQADIMKSKVAIEYCKKNNIEYKFYLGEQNELKENLSYIFNNK